VNAGRLRECLPESRTMFSRATCGYSGQTLYQTQHQDGIIPRQSNRTAADGYKSMDNRLYFISLLPYLTISIYSYIKL